MPGEECGPNADVVSCCCTSPNANENIAIHSTSFQGKATRATGMRVRSANGIERKAAPTLTIVTMGNTNKYTANHGNMNPFIVYTMSAAATMDAE